MADEQLSARTEPGGSTDSVIARFPAERALWIFAAGNGFAVVLLAVKLIQGWRLHDWTQVVFFGAFLPILVPSLAVTLRMVSTSAFLTPQSVSTPRLWGRRVLSLVEVTGVGLRYVPGQRGFTWRLKVWRTITIPHGLTALWWFMSNNRNAANHPG